YGRYLHERTRGKPTQYITGVQEFYGRPFRVTPAVLVPRPETEHVVETALPLCRDGARVVDVGCGSGNIAVSLRLESGARVWATDIAPAALAVAAKNCARLGAEVALVCCDLASAIASGSIDLVVSNPPYVPAAEYQGLQREVRDWEPRQALIGGVEFYQRLIDDAARVLRPGGRLVVELGYTSAGPVGQLLAKWEDVRFVDDLADIPRVVSARALR
ncbi:MAG: peptide chain release factor N(5)-glutamine methyltransferase, partial [Bryobacteraceae bacterium]